jgi:hypothetical protein
MCLQRLDLEMALVGRVESGVVERRALYLVFEDANRDT